MFVTLLILATEDFGIYEGTSGLGFPFQAETLTAFLGTSGSVHINCRAASFTGLVCSPCGCSTAALRRSCPARRIRRHGIGTGNLNGSLLFGFKNLNRGKHLIGFLGTIGESLLYEMRDRINKHNGD